MSSKGRVTILEEETTGAIEMVASLEARTGTLRTELTDLEATATAAIAKMDEIGHMAEVTAHEVEPLLAERASEFHIRRAGTTDASGQVTVDLNPPRTVNNVIISCGVSPAGKSVIANFSSTKNSQGKTTQVVVTFYELVPDAPVKTTVTLLNLSIGATMGKAEVRRNAGAGVEYYVTVAADK